MTFVLSELIFFLNITEQRNIKRILWITIKKIHPCQHINNSSILNNLELTEQRNIKRILWITIKKFIYPNEIFFYMGSKSNVIDIVIAKKK